MSMKQRIPILALALLLLGTLAPTGASAEGNGEPAPLVIREQGSFVVGGTVITAPGTYDPIKQGAYNPTSVNP